MATNRKVLILDDSETVLEAAAMVLEEGGFTVVAVKTAAAFLSAIYREEPDVALIDISMPIDGTFLISLAKRHRTNCALVFYSDRSEAELRTLAARYGADGHVTKSADGSALIATIQRLIPGAAPVAAGG